MRKINIQETNLNEKSTLKSSLGYCIIQEYRPKERGKGGGVAFIIEDTILFHELNLRLSDRHLEVQAIELTAGGNKLVNTYIPPSSSCNAGYESSISKLLDLDDCIIVGYFNAHSPLWHSKPPEETRGSNFATEIDPSNHVVLNEKASTRVIDYCKSSKHINASSTH